MICETELMNLRGFMGGDAIKPQKPPDLSQWWAVGLKLERETERRGRKITRGIVSYRIRLGELQTIQTACGTVLVRIDDVMGLV